MQGYWESKIKREFGMSSFAKGTIVDSRIELNFYLQLSDYQKISTSPCQNVN